MLVPLAIAVGAAVAGLVLVKRARPAAPPLPPAIENGVAGDNGARGQTPTAAKPADRGPPKELTDALHYAKEGLGILKGDSAAAAKAVTEVLGATVVANARSEEAKLVAGIGTTASGIVAGGVAAAFVSGSLGSYALTVGATAGPVGLAIVTAAIVVTAIVTNIVEAAIALDRIRQQPFVQAEIDNLVKAGRLMEAWALTLEAQKHGISAGFMVSVPTWGDARECIAASDINWPDGKPGGGSFYDAEKLIQAAYAPAFDALQLDIQLPWQRNEAGQLVRPRTNRDKPAAVAARAAGDDWCRYIGGHWVSGVGDDGKTAVNVWTGKTPWQASDMLQQNYAPHDPPDAASKDPNATQYRKPGTFAATTAGQVAATTPTAAPGATAGNTSSTSTGGGRAHAGDGSQN